MTLVQRRRAVLRAQIAEARTHRCRVELAEPAVTAQPPAPFATQASSPVRVLVWGHRRVSLHDWQPGDLETMAAPFDAPLPEQEKLVELAEYR